MTKNKDKKGKESTIGKIIYGFLLFMPLFAIGVTSLYAIFNKNAYQSKAIGNETQSVQLTTGSTLIEHEEYIVSAKYEQHSTSPAISFYSISIDLSSYPTADNFKIYDNRTGSYLLTFYDSNNTQLFDISFGNPDQTGLQQFQFTYKSSNYQSLTEYANVYQLYTTDRPLSDIFYYSIEKVEESNLFNWSKNSIVYTTLVTTCNALSITNTFIPMLLAYWLIISVIYILYDIALMMIIIFHHKVHCLQDSI